MKGAAAEPAPERRTRSAMRVLMFVPDAGLTGGVITFLDTLLGHFSDAVSAERFVVGRRRDGWQARVGPVVVLFDLVRLARRVRRERFDVIHANPSLDSRALLRDGLFLLLLRFMNAGPTCVFIHGWNVRTESRLTRSRAAKFLFTHSFGHAAHTFVLASPFRDRLLALGFDPARVSVATTMFSGSDVDRRGRERRELRTLLFMSRFVREKGVYEVLEAFGELRRRGHDVRLVLAGSGPEEAGMRRVVADNGLPERVRFTGYVRGAAKAAVLAEADVFVLPTRHGEGCPVSVLEAMAAGLPVITTAAGGIPDVVVHGRNGTILPDASAEALVRAVEALVEQPAVAHEIGLANRGEAWSRYEASVVTRQIETAYDAL